MKPSTKQIETHPIEDTNGMFSVTFNGFFDNRGYLFKYFTPQLFEPIRKDLVWRQVIIQQTEKRNTIRGIHAQAHPFVESKLLVALRGKMFWVCVDLRKNSPRFGKWNHFVLDASTNVGLYVERGFAHGCCSLEDDTELLILADNDFAAGLGIHYQDPDLNIEWPTFEKEDSDGIKSVMQPELVISDAHRTLGSFKDFCRTYEGL